MATIREVSRLARVSMATVSRVLNDTVPVAEATRDRVLAAVAELDYRPNRFARSLATNRSGGLGVIVKALSSPFFSPMLHGIENVAESQGMHLMVSSGHVDAHTERRALDFMLDRRPDALILDVEGLSDDFLGELAAGPIPLFFIGRLLPKIPERCVYLDNVAGGVLMTKHLIERGHRRIAHITGLLAIHDSRERLAGYRTALEEAGIEFDPDLVVESDFQEQGGERALRELLAKGTEFTAVFAANDQMAAGALAALRDAGRDVPGEISLVGHDDILLARYLFPALTTARQPIAEMGAAVTTMALAALGANTEEVRHRFEPTLVSRASVRALA
jgi:LacI family transcriptional regulator